MGRQRKCRTISSLRSAAMGPGTLYSYPDEPLHICTTGATPGVLKPSPMHAFTHTPSCKEQNICLLDVCDDAHDTIAGHCGQTRLESRASIALTGHK
ncbi:hypothetical protein HaLaN_25758 [Haematococcus lacustris]|uniref:Uncharacterized protein n=1 Tax=Haematococcus lacustris TaxID=44745 RepID=A0A6A0A4N3_HAELA|nr:hypothetical protein HaLaN_25758 [Haematococcus lacustris]